MPSPEPEKAADKMQPPERQYPEGLRLFFIMLAICMSIFLVSVDQVRYLVPSNKH